MRPRADRVLNSVKMRCGSSSSLPRRGFPWRRLPDPIRRRSFCSWRRSHHGNKCSRHIFERPIDISGRRFPSRRQPRSVCRRSYVFSGTDLHRRQTRFSRAWHRRITARMSVRTQARTSTVQMTLPVEVVQMRQRLAMRLSPPDAAPRTRSKSMDDTRLRNARVVFR